MITSDFEGIYLVVDPSMDQSLLLDKVEQALEGGVSILQLWNNWPDKMQKADKEQLTTYLIEMAAKYDVPVLINNEWKLLKTTKLAGIHFDEIPEDFDQIKKEIGRDFIAGITCSNDLDIVEWAEEKGFDYVSFCAMYPSPSVGSCEIVHPDTVRKAREITSMPLFLSGGITPKKIAELENVDYNGVAVISGILKDEFPRQQAKKYKQALTHLGIGHEGYYP